MPKEEAPVVPGENSLAVEIGGAPNAEAALALFVPELDGIESSDSRAVASISSLTPTRLPRTDAFVTLEPVGSTLAPPITGVRLVERAEAPLENPVADTPESPAAGVLRPVEETCPSDHGAVPTSKNGIRQSIRKVFDCIL
jgi:hypothetical protein